MNSKPPIIVQPPVKPRLVPVLHTWDNDGSLEVEVAEAIIADEDFSQITRLEAEGCVCKNTVLTAVRLEKLRLSDSTFSRLEAAGLHAGGTALLRIEINDSRLTGADFGASTFSDCTFKGVKLDETGFRFAKFKRVRFEGCILRQADFSGAQFTHVTFVDCDFEETNFDNAVCKAVDVREQNLTSIQGVLGLKGATISSEQLIQLAPLLAVELQLTIDDE